MAPSLGWLIFFRVLQGLGGGGLGPSEQAILADTFPPAKRGMAFADLRHGRGARARRSARRSAASSPTTSAGAGSSSSTCPVGHPVAASLEPHRHRSAAPREAKKSARQPIDYVGPRPHRARPGRARGGARQGAGGRLVRVALHRRFSILAARRARLVRGLGVAPRAPGRRRAAVQAQELRRRQHDDARCWASLCSARRCCLPQYTQVLMGYTAEQAGMALSPGAVRRHHAAAARRAARRPGSTRASMIAFGFAVLSRVAVLHDAAPLPGHRLPRRRCSSARVPVRRPGVPVRAHQHARRTRACRPRRTTRSPASSTCRATWAATSGSRS